MIFLIINQPINNIIVFLSRKKNLKMEKSVKYQGYEKYGEMFE